ncbi:MAG: hypothetical protein VYA21_00795 [Verrucomicrobiota bacterium]|nr:hypothetical protein [Verrucomicrobiota bacterium]
MGDTSFDCSIKSNARDSLLSGRFDPLNELLSGVDSVASVALKLPYMQT